MTLSYWYTRGIALASASDCRETWEAIWIRCSTWPAKQLSIKNWLLWSSNYSGRSVVYSDVRRAAKRRSL
jgi:hypothetical protein